MPIGIYTAGVDLGKMRSALRAKRLELKWSLDDLAAKSGVNRSTIHDIETNADGKPQMATVARLVEGMGLTLSEFFARIEGLKPQPLTAQNALSSQGIQSAEVALGGSVVSGGGVPSNDFVHEAIIIGIAEQLADRFAAAIDKLADARRQAPVPRAHAPVRHARRRKTG